MVLSPATIRDRAYVPLLRNVALMLRSSNPVQKDGLCCPHSQADGALTSNDPRQSICTAFEERSTNGSLLGWVDWRLLRSCPLPGVDLPMTTRRPCPPAPGPLEAYAARFDPLLSSLAQRRGLRDYLQGQRLQWFLSESTWDHQAVNQQRIQLLCQDPATAPHAQGVLVIDDTGDRKDGRHTAHVARQYLGSVGKTDNGIVAVTSLWADARCYWPLHLVPYTPASRLAKGKSDPGFRTKPKLAAELVEAAQQAKIPFRAVVADCFYGDNPGFVEALGRAGVAFVLALKPRKGTWAPAEAAHTPIEAARELGWGGPRAPGQWRRVTRRFRDGHTETWWAADAVLGGWGPAGPHRLVVATTDPERLPKLTTWYLLTNLARPASRRAQQAQLGEIVRLYGLRNWVEQGYKQVKDELGWADFQVRADRAIRRHWTLVCCAFSFGCSSSVGTVVIRLRGHRCPGREGCGHAGSRGRGGSASSGRSPRWW